MHPYQIKGTKRKNCNIPKILPFYVEGIFMSKKAYQGKMWLAVGYSNKELDAG